MKMSAKEMYTQFAKHNMRYNCEFHYTLPPFYTQLKLTWATSVDSGQIKVNKWGAGIGRLGT